MDFEHVAHGLHPLITGDQVDINHCLDLLNDLAVALRSPDNRNTVGRSGLLEDLISILEQRSEDELTPELVRCVANCLVDNMDNRIVWHRRRSKLKTSLIQGLSQDWSYCVAALLYNSWYDEDDDSEFWDTDMYIALLECGLLNCKETRLLAFQLIDDVYLEARRETVVSNDQLSRLLTILNDVAFHVTDIQPDDENTIILGPLTRLIERSLEVNKNPVDAIGRLLLDTLKTLETHSFADKLIILRRIVTSIAMLSANRNLESNKADREQCLLNITHGGYATAACLILLSNSIENRSDANEILSIKPFSDFLILGTQFKDPIQLQGYLDIIRKLIGIPQALELTPSHLVILSEVLHLAQAHVQFWPGLNYLVQNLWKKLLAVLSGNQIERLLFEDSNLSTVCDNNMLSSLALDKLILGNKQINSKLWDSFFKFNTQGEQGLTMLDLFQITKTLGIHFKNSRDPAVDPVLTEHLEGLISVLDTVQGMKHKSDNGSVSVCNNGRFIAGVLTSSIEQHDLTNRYHNLVDKCKLLLT